MLQKISLLLVAFSVQAADPVYEALSEKRKLLFENYLKAQPSGNAAASSAAAFDAMSLSERTTFYAISHALEKTTLTTKDGRSLGAMIDFIASLEQIAGQYKGKRGDEQFRIYCHLKPKAVDALSESVEFFRDKDNTVYHKDYPINFRTAGKVPSMQVSIARTGQKADIDVDYRTSRLPMSAVNGHLSAANSDVRAGANPKTHNRKWNGLVVWWRELFNKGAETEAPAVAQAETTPLPPDRPPKNSPEKIEDAAVEFLADWLIRREIDEAMAATSTTMMACTNSDDDTENETVSGNQARDLFRRTLREVSGALGRKGNLGLAIAALPPWDPELRVVNHPFAKQFTLVSVADGEAEEFRCRKTTSAAGDVAAPAQQEYGRQFQTLFRFLLPSGEGGGLVLLWSKENDGWRIVSFDALEP